MAEIHDLTTECCPENIPGFESTIYVVPACDIENFPTPQDYDPADPAASVILVDEIVLKASKKFFEIPVIIDTADIKSTANGSIGSKGFRNETNFQIQGSNAKALSWSNQVLNGCFVAVLIDKMGRNRVIGSKLSPARFETIEQVNGSEDSKGTYLLFDTRGKIAPIYEGNIDLDNTP